MPIRLNVTRGMNSRTRKINEEQAREIKQLLTKQVTSRRSLYREIGKRYNLHAESIRAIDIGKSWAHLWSK